jgi:hypothetical protein
LNVPLDALKLSVQEPQGRSEMDTMLFRSLRSYLAASLACAALLPPLACGQELEFNFTGVLYTGTPAAGPIFTVSFEGNTALGSFTDNGSVMSASLPVTNFTTTLNGVVLEQGESGVFGFGGTQSLGTAGWIGGSFGANVTGGGYGFFGEPDFVIGPPTSLYSLLLGAQWESDGGSPTYVLQPGTPLYLDPQAYVRGSATAVPEPPIFVLLLGAVALLCGRFWLTRTRNIPKQSSSQRPEQLTYTPAINSAMDTHIATRPYTLMRGSLPLLMS